MATEKQIQANRNNAQASTGPRSEEGKARVSQNALKHGLLARDAVLPGEDPAEFEAQLTALEDDIRPTDALERELVRQIADAQWRMRRLTRLETGYLAAALDNTRQLSVGSRCKESKPGYEGDTLLLGYSLMRSTQVLAHFARYDAHLGRRFERAIQQIARLRDAREQRRPAESQEFNEMLYRPAGPENGGAPHPSNGAPAAPPDHSGPQTQAPQQNDGTKPISSNDRQISNLETGRSSSRPLTLPPAPQHTPQIAPNNTPPENQPVLIRPESPPR